MSTWINTFKHPIDYLLLENSDNILLETGDNIVLDQTGNSTALWSQTAKN